MLTLRGIRVADLESARLLRRSASGARAWVVPVGDLRPLIGAPPIVCVSRPARRARPPRAVPVPGRPPRVQRVRPRLPVPFGPAPFLPPQLDLSKSQEGLVVVAEGGAAAGGGGTHKQLIRGLAAPSVEPCSGPKRDLVSVSGIVPDGVGAAFLTSADGTAVKTEVKDNGYAFLVPPAKGREAFAPRYVVWVGGDGTPHVQHVVLSRLPRRLCTGLARRRSALVQVTPSGGLFAEPAPLLSVLRAPRPAPVPRPRRP